MRKTNLTALGLFFGALAGTFAADFTVTNTSNTGTGSLRQAILDANASPGLDRVLFNIPGPGVHRIELFPEPLPEVTDAVIIDGYTQPGAAPNTSVNSDNAVILIQLDGGGAGNATTYFGLVITAGGSTVRGLSIGGLPGMLRPGTYDDGAAIRLSIAGGNTITGNFLGLEPDGMTHSGASAGVLLESNGNRVGGTSPADRNVCSGNNAGVTIAAPDGNQVLGNFLGTDASGTMNGGNGIGVLAPSGYYRNTIIGGVSPGAANVILGNFTGVQIGSNYYASPQPAFGVAVKGNLIGVASDGKSRIGLGNDGILILGSNNMIGGPEPGAGNVIWYNRHAGVSVIAADSIGNRILSNAYYFNGVSTVNNIDLGGDGPTSNDLGDGDKGANGLQNFPIIVSSEMSGNNVTLHAELDSAPAAEFVVQVYVGHPPGSRLAGTTTVPSDSSGRARFDVSFTRVDGDSDFYYATATDAAGNTSEFSRVNGPVQLANISTRGNVQTGDNILIAGFVVHTSSMKKVMIRALGPSLKTPTHLADPYLELYDEHGTLIAKNDDWRAGQQQEIMASGIPPSSDVESALITSLPAGNYTAHVHGARGEVGTGIVEVYDLDAFSYTSGRLVNISTRGLVSLDDDVLIGGFIVRGDNAERVIIRGIGPDLTGAGVPNALADPTLELHDRDGSLIASNDNWRSSQEQEIRDSKLAPNDDRDSATIASLAPGVYTAVLRGKNNTTGVGLVEFYDLKQ